MRVLLSSILLACFVTSVFAVDGLVSLKSSHGVGETIDRLESIVTDQGMTVFIRIKHQEGANKVGLELRPTELLIFGNPKVGTPFMLCGQSVAIELPQKALAWEDESGQVWLSYNDPQYLANRHNMTGCDDIIAKISKALENFAKAAAMP